MVKCRTRVFLIAVTFMVLGASVAAADDGPPPARIIGDRFQVSVGGFLVDLQTSARAARDGRLLGTIVQLEDDLGVDESLSTFRLDGFYRIRPAHTLEFGYFLIKREGRTAIEREIEFRDLTFDVGASLQTDFNTQLFKGAYRYTFVNDGRSEAVLR